MRGNEDPTPETGATSTGAPAPGGPASSTQRIREPPRKKEDPRYDDDEYLFGPDREEEDEVLGSVAVHDTSTGSCATGGPGNRLTKHDAEDWYRESAQSTCVRSSRLHA